MVIFINWILVHYLTCGSVLNFYFILAWVQSNPLGSVMIVINNISCCNMQLLVLLTIYHHPCTEKLLWWIINLNIVSNSYQPGLSNHDAFLQFRKLSPLVAVAQTEDIVDLFSCLLCGKSIIFSWVHSFWKNRIASKYYIFWK